MNLHETDLSHLLRSDHPAKPFIFLGGAAIAIGIIRGRLSGLALIGVGGFALKKALLELQRTNGLHGGNFHGQNGPPRIEDRVTML